MDEPPRDVLLDQLWTFVEALGRAGRAPSGALVDLVTRAELDRAARYAAWWERVG